jgi:solute carrier family 25 2-oxodicarboxylate transporter 21
MEAPKRATKFAANDSWGQFYKNAFGVQKMNQSLSILTGATAGATEAFVVVPFELVKIRLQDKAQAGRYSGAADAVVKIVRQEGLLALYNGLEATLWRYVDVTLCVLMIQAHLVECWILWVHSSCSFGAAKSDFQKSRIDK